MIDPHDDPETSEAWYWSGGRTPAGAAGSGPDTTSPGHLQPDPPTWAPPAVAGRPGERPPAAGPAYPGYVVDGYGPAVDRATDVGRPGGDRARPATGSGRPPYGPSYPPDGPTGSYGSPSYPPYGPSGTYGDPGHPPYVGAGGPTGSSGSGGGGVPYGPWGAPYGSGGGDPKPASSRRPARRTLAAGLVGAVTVAAAGVGILVGHVAWSPAAAKSAAPNLSTSSGGNGSGSSGSGSTGSGSSGSLGSGRGGSGNSGSGSLGSGSGGSGFPGSGFPGSGSSGSNGSFGGSYPGGYSGSGNSSGSTGGSTSTGSSGLSESAVNAIAAKVAPALVDINGTFPYQDAEGAGTGIVLTSSGTVLTNNHVIDGATSISVTDLGNGKTYKATVAGYDASHDIAVLHLEGATGLKTASLANSSTATVGETVVAIGNAGGVGGTPSSAAGTITALNQSITASNELDGTNENLTGLIQTNADIQSGDSGGALVNQNGQVLAMNTAAASGGSSYFSTSGNATEGYAIPLNQAYTTAKAIESGSGTSTIHVGPTAFLGLLLSSDSSSDQPGSYGGYSGYSGGNAPTSGAPVYEVVTGGPAATAGVTQGDVISALDGQAVASDTALGTLLVTHHPGDKVQLTWTDTSGQTHTTTVTLASGPPA